MYKLLSVSLLILMGACAQAEDVSRTVAVSGTGTVTAAPDRASLQLSIEARDKAVRVAQDEAASVTERVLAVTDKLDIDRSRVDTTGASVRPDYQYNRETNQQILKGYIATRQISVEIRDIDNLAQVIEGVVTAGVNQVSPPQLFSSKSRDLYRDALAAASDDARKNAETLAESLGMKLGDAIQVDTGSRPMPYANQRSAGVAMMSASDAEATYNPGDLSTSATINVVFELHMK